MLQALFNKIWVDNEGVIGSEFTQIYKNIAGPIEKDIAQRNEKSASDNSDADFPDRLLKSYSKFFEKGLNNELLVEHRRFEGPNPLKNKGYNLFVIRHNDDDHCAIQISIGNKKQNPKCAESTCYNTSLSRPAL